MTQRGEGSVKTGPTSRPSCLALIISLDIAPTDSQMDTTEDTTEDMIEDTTDSHD
jgi:hypothetical protein